MTLAFRRGKLKGFVILSHRLGDNLQITCERRGELECHTILGHSREHNVLVISETEDRDVP